MRWLLSAIGVVVLSIAIWVAQSVLFPSNRSPRPPDFEHTLGTWPDGTYGRVSLVALLANPERYDGQKVLTEGFVTLTHENCGLYLDETAQKAGLQSNALWLNLGRRPWCGMAAGRPLDRRYGEVAGTFEASETGHMGVYSGGLVDVRSIRRRPTEDEFRRYLHGRRQGVLRGYFLSAPVLAIAGWTGLFILWLFRRRSAAG